MDRKIKAYEKIYRKAIEKTGLTRHVEFIRHSDLSDGPACHDEVIRKC